jgi:hypothetical protein
MKVFWCDREGSVHYLTMMQDEGASAIQNRLKELHMDEYIDTVHLTGMGPVPKFPEGMAVKRLSTLSETPDVYERIRAELIVQTRGVRHLLASEPHTPARFLTVSVGTGISYALIDTDDRVEQPLIGNPVGAEVLRFFTRLFDQPPPDGWLFPDLPPEMDYDLRMKDVVGEAAAGIVGDFIVGHLAKAPDNRADFRYAKILSSIANMVAVGISRDILIIREKLGTKLPEDIIFIGGGLRYEILKRYVSKYVRMLGLAPIFPPLGAFAGAIGAYLSDDFV